MASDIVKVHVVDIVVVCRIPRGDFGEEWAGIFCERMEEESIDHDISALYVKGES
jgi:hypothetical protein